MYVEFLHQLLGKADLKGATKSEAHNKRKKSKLLFTLILFLLGEWWKYFFILFVI